jgi:uncharacterized membrane protein YgcG
LHAFGATQITAEMKMNRIFHVLAASLLIMAVNSAAYATSRQTIGPKEQACFNEGGHWDAIYDPDQSCPETLPDGSSYSENCGHCFDHDACQAMNGIWDSNSRVCLYNNHLYTDYPGWCNGTIGGEAPDGGFNPYSAPMCVTNSSSGNSTGSQGSVTCPPGYETDAMGVCTWAQSGPNTGIFCIDNPLLCILNGGFVYTELPLIEDCFEYMDITDDSQLCGPGIIEGPGNGGRECLSRGGSIASDVRSRRLTCWSRTNAGAAPARLEIPPYDDKAKGVLENCRARGHSLTLQDRALACIETPQEVIRAVAQHYASAPQLSCKPPTVPNKNRTACICPAGTQRRGKECVRPIECPAPQVANVDGVCGCPPATVLRGKECVRPIVCHAPLVPNASGTECVCPPGTVQRGQQCVRPIVCRAPLVPNAAGTVCVCPPGLVQRGGTCMEQRQGGQGGGPRGGGEGGGRRGGEGPRGGGGSGSGGTFGR